MEHSIWEFFVGHRPGWLVDVAKFLAFVGDETVLLPVTLVVAIVDRKSTRLNSSHRT